VRKLERFYTTILYLFIGDVVSIVLLYNNPLWALCEFADEYRFVHISTTAVLCPALFCACHYIPLRKRRRCFTFFNRCRDIGYGVFHLSYRRFFILQRMDYPAFDCFLCWHVYNGQTSL
jgi:hypothetical protein